MNIGLKKLDITCWDSAENIPHQFVYFRVQQSWAPSRPSNEQLENQN